MQCEMCGADVALLIFADQATEPPAFIVEEDPVSRPYLGAAGRLLDALAADQPRTHTYAQCRAEGPAAWSAKARATLLERLNFNPPPVPLAARVLARTPGRGYVRETVEFASTRHHRIKGEFLVPEGARPPLPAVLALHDHGGFYSHGREKLVEGLSDSPALASFVEQSYAGRYWASELARRGYAVLVTEAQDRLHPGQGA